MLLAKSISSWIGRRCDFLGGLAPLLLCLIMAVAAIGLLPSALAAQETDFERQSALWQQDDRAGGFGANLSERQWKRGFHGLNVICMGVELEHQSLTRWRRTPADQTVLVMMGNFQAGAIAGNPIDLDFYLDNGGAVLIASDTENSRELRRQGIRFTGPGMVAANRADFFNGEFNDCPVVTNIQLPIPLLEGIDSFVTNRPGVLLLAANTPWKRLAYLPALVGSPHGNLFSVGGENRAGGKLVCFSDHSLFSNQMLMRGDNALAAKQCLEWLKGPNRKQVLVLVDGVVQSQVNPADLNVELPHPTPQEAFEAAWDLGFLPMLDFGDSVLAAVEDEDMINEMINNKMDRIRRPKINRFLIFLTFALACCFALITYTWQKKLRRRTISDIANIKALENKKSDKRMKKTEASQTKLCFERQMAALALLDSFCLDFANRRFEDFENFPEGLEIGSDEHGVGIKYAMKTIGDDYRNQPRKFWNEKRLLGVEGAVNHWRAYFESGMSRRAVQEKIVEASVVDL